MVKVLGKPCHFCRQGNHEYCVSKTQQVPPDHIGGGVSCPCPCGRQEERGPTGPVVDIRIVHK